jgi:hypothetical protein
MWHYDTKKFKIARKMQKITKNWWLRKKNDVSHNDTLTRLWHRKSWNSMDPVKTAECTGGAPTCYITIQCNCSACNVPPDVGSQKRANFFTLIVGLAGKAAAITAQPSTIRLWHNVKPFTSGVAFVWAIFSWKLNLLQIHIPRNSPAPQCNQWYKNIADERLRKDFSSTGSVRCTKNP